MVTALTSTSSHHESMALLSCTKTQANNNKFETMMFLITPIGRPIASFVNLEQSRLHRVRQLLSCTKRDKDLRRLILISQRSLCNVSHSKAIDPNPQRQSANIFLTLAADLTQRFISQPHWSQRSSSIITQDSLTLTPTSDLSAAMTEMNALEMLAPELQLKVLLNADTPEDLHALIQASPRLFHIFLLNKNIILAAVARRQFHPAVILDALFFAKIAQLEQPLPRDTVLDLCRTYPGDLHEGTVLPIQLSVALCKLARNVKFFIEDYTRNTLPLMEDLGRSLAVDVLTEYRPENPVSYSQLSESETGRLQRAFCRFEIYRYLFARCSPELDHSVRNCLYSPSLGPEEQASLFLRKCPDFQVAELNCVRDYLYRRLRGIFSQLEDEAVNTLPPETLDFGEEGDVESDEWDSGVWLFCKSGKAYQNQHLEHLLSLGLSYIRRIFQSTGEERRNLFIRHINIAVINHIESDFITSALEVSGFNPVAKDVPLLPETDPPFVYETNADVELDIPDAWQWAYSRAPPSVLSDFLDKGLRDWGFVFWDLGRLRESGVLERR